MAGFGASDVLVCGRSRRGTAFVCALALPPVAWLLCEATGRSDLQDYVALLGAGEAIGFFLLPAIEPSGVWFITGERRGPLRATREGITFHGRLLLPRAQVRNVAVEGLSGGKQIVHVAAMRAKHDVRISLESDQEARALVAALELDPDRHVATFSVEEDPLRGRMAWLAARLLVGAVGLALAAGVLLLARRQQLFLLALVPVLLVYALLLPRARVRTDVALAADGLTVRHRGRARSIALSAIAELRTSPNVATVVLTSGEELVLRFGSEGDAAATLQHGSFVTRLRQALARHRRPHEPSEAMLVRGARDANDWKRHLLEIGKVEEGYRVAPMREETLWRIAEGAVAEPSARVGALVALRSRLDDEAKVRLHDLAACTAQRDLRAALEAAAEGAEADEIIAAYERAAER